MAFTQIDVDSLKRAIATGAQQAMIQGEMVQYRSLKDMKEILRMMKSEVAGPSASSQFPVSYATTTRGL
ncbi:MAG: hypothetical protein L3J37_00320 [Rhodobacteraceae bacterium]|nr:hypothetical protein [Paracoccaceae bacterium]